MIPVRELLLDFLCYRTLSHISKLLTWSPCCSHILRNLTILCLKTVLAEILVCSSMAENFTRRTWIYLWVEGFPILLIDHTELRFLVKYPTKYLVKSFIALANLHQRKYLKEASDSSIFVCFGGPFLCKRALFNYLAKLHHCMCYLLIPSRLLF